MKNATEKPPRVNGPGSSESMLSVEDLHVRYGLVDALRGVSLAARAGSITVVLAPNGAGKTTLFRAVAGLHPPVSGRITLDGADVTGRPAPALVRQGVALVPEGRHLFAPLTVRENLRLGMLRDGWVGQRQTFRSRLADVCDLLPMLAEKLDTPAGDLSGGQQQMVAIGRALMARPRLLLLDEPSFGLAPLIVEDVFVRLLRMHHEMGVTVLLSEQNIDNALAVADYAYVLSTGRVAAQGTPEEIGRDVSMSDIYLGRHHGTAGEADERD